MTQNAATRSRRPWLFLVLVLVFSVPFYLLNLTSLPAPFDLPPSFLMIVVPLGVALILARRERGGVRALVEPFGVARKKLGWLVFAILLVPALIAGMHAISALQASEEFGSPRLSLGTALVVFAVYFLGAIPEEVGWTMYATRPLQERFGPLVAGVIIGAVWGVWHVLPFMSQGRDWGWIAAQVAVSIVVRVIMGMVFARSGESLLPALLIHTSMNFYVELLPNGIADYRPDLVLVLAAVVVVGLVIGFPAVFNRPVPERVQ